MSNAPRPLSDRFLSLAEREEIMVLHAKGESQAEIGRILGRSAGTISRELTRNTVVGEEYRASVAQAWARQRAKRPKVAKLAVDGELRDLVQDGLLQKWSPQQVSKVLRKNYADRPELQVSHETIYQALYVQSRGALRRELTVCLRTGRALRKPQRQAQVRRERAPGRIQEMVNISERPAEAEDRAVPGHWEGDLICGSGHGSAIGTLVERTTRFVMLLHLPDGRDAVTVAGAMAAMIATLPERMWASLTWDQGKEMAHHARITAQTGVPVYFADPHSPWQRGTNENTNGLLRQYFPKGTDLSVYSAEYLAAVAAQLNERPRETLGWLTPAECLQRLLFPDESTSIATTS
jgi:IS30 family transposase